MNRAVLALGGIAAGLGLFEVVRRLSAGGETTPLLDDEDLRAHEASQRAFQDPATIPSPVTDRYAGPIEELDPINLPPINELATGTYERIFTVGNHRDFPPGTDKLRPGESIGSDGAVRDSVDLNSLTDRDSYLKIVKSKCARQIALKEFSPEAQDYLMRFSDHYNPALNQEIDCEGVEVPEAQVDSAREGLKLLLPSIMSGIEPTRRDLSLR